MAELGTDVSVVQLVDVALRVSGEVRSFLDAYKDIGRDTKYPRDSDHGVPFALEDSVYIFSLT